MDKISLHRMMFYGYHGVFPEERKLGQRFIVDVDLYLDLQPAGRSDDLAQTIHYAEAYEVIRRIAAYPKIVEVTVKITKPQPPFAGDFDGVSVELTRRREQG